MNGGMDGVGDVGKDGVRVCSGQGWVWNIIRCLWGEQYNDSMILLRYTP